MNLERNRVHNLDVLDGLRQMEDGCVQTVVTSPPYWSLRDYGVAGQIGLEPTLEEYIERLVGVFREVRRVLRKDGTCWVNMGDGYASNPASGGPGQQEGGEHHRTPKRGYNRPLGLKPKDLCGVPWRLALALQADGWWLRSDIIWAKPNPMPESVTDRPTKSHEYVFMLTKAARYFYDADAVREAHKPESVERYQHGFERDKRSGTGLVMADAYETVHGNPAGRNLRTVWTIPTQPFPEAHFATFPEKLVEPCIKAGTSAQACEHCGAAWERVTEHEYKCTHQRINNTKPRQHAGYIASRGENVSKLVTTIGFRPTCTCANEGKGRCLVLDPFMGSGTVGVVAGLLERDWIGFELNAEYCEMANKRIAERVKPKLWEAGK